MASAACGVRQLHHLPLLSSPYPLPITRRPRWDDCPSQGQSTCFMCQHQKVRLPGGVLDMQAGCA